MTMSIIDDLRGALEKAREMGLAKAIVKMKEEAVEAALRQWWKQDCREIPDEEASCPCGKVAVKPGEDPLVWWCAAGHPLTPDGKIEIPPRE
jgi:hypothetical protein